MFKIVRCDTDMATNVGQMLHELGEPPQVLTKDSPRPLVVHHVMGQMTLVTGGAGFALLAGRTVALTAGDLFILTPGCEHSFVAGDDDLHLRHWHWPQALLEHDRTVLEDEASFDTVAAELDAEERRP
jgi:hypothetical protein